MVRFLKIFTQAHFFKILCYNSTRDFPLYIKVISKMWKLDRKVLWIFHISHTVIRKFPDTNPFSLAFHIVPVFQKVELFEWFLFHSFETSHHRYYLYKCVYVLFYKHACIVHEWIMRMKNVIKSSWVRAILQRGTGDNVTCLYLAAWLFWMCIKVTEIGKERNEVAIWKEEDGLGLGKFGSDGERDGS